MGRAMSPQASPFSGSSLTTPADSTPGSLRTASSVTLVERLPRRLLVVGLRRQVDPRGHYLLGVESAVHAHQPHQARGQQPRHQHQGHADGHFHAYQGPPQLLAAAAFARHPRLATDRLDRIHPPRHPSRRSARHQRSRKGKQERAACSRPIDVRCPKVIQCGRHIPSHGRNQRRGKQESQPAAGYGQHRCLADRHAHQVTAARAQRRSHRHLLPLPHRATQQQVGNVDAAHQQQPCHRRQQDQQRLRLSPTSSVLSEVREAVNVAFSSAGSVDWILRSSALISPLAWAAVTPGFSRATP